MDISVILAFASALLAGALALAVAWYERRSVAHWAFVGGMAVFSAESVFAGLAADAVLPADVVNWQNWRLLAMSFVPAVWLFFSLTFARGNSREFLTRWRFRLIFAMVVPVSLALTFHGRLINAIERTAPGSPWVLTVGLPAFLIYLVFLVAAVVVLMNLERTFRASIGTMRWRIKFTVLGVGILFVARAYTSSQILLSHSLNLSLQVVNSGALLVTFFFMLRSLSRSGHFEVLVYPSHSLLHSSLTVMLAGLYLFIVGVLAKAVTFLGGENSFALKAFVVLVGLVLLAVLLLSEKVRWHTRRFVSRHFQRPFYDYRSVWRRFTEATARCVEQSDLCEAVIKLVSQVFQALSVTIWLVDERKQSLVFAGSTTVLRPKASSLTLDVPDMEQVVAALRNHPDPLDIDASKEIWAVLLRRLHPDEFRRGGNRICAPLIAGNELLGVMTLGDRVGGISYSVQDFDLLKSVSEQAAANLLNVQLSQRVTQGKQLEAFQSMSTFFVHDLKNTASTLSLMLQNLPAHFDDPEFRKDALRGIGNTVTHINDLIARLAALRQDLQVRAVETDLNELIAGVTGILMVRNAVDTNQEVLQDFSPLPKVNVDPVQFQSVITNLVLNAREATSPGGRIKIGTSRHNGWAIVSVSDTGCGMTPEFIQSCLFRPFQTTKKKGMGIGMFQSRLIVEAHHGRIEVESEPAKGTTFRVLLPLASPSSS